EAFRNIVERTKEGVYRSIPEGRYIMANEAFARMLGYDSPGELMESVLDIGKQVYVDSADRDASIRKVLEKGHGEMEIQIRCRDGRSRWVLNSVRVVRDGEGRVSFFEGIVKDISERKAVEESLRRSEERCRLLLDNLPVVTYSYLPGHPARELFVGGWVETLTGYTEEEFARDPSLVHDMMHPQDREELLGTFTSDLQGASAGERVYRILDRRGVEKWVRDCYRFDRDEDGKIVRVYGFLEDISLKRETEEALREKEEKLSIILSTMNDMIFVADLQGIFRFVTPSCESISGYRPEDLVGRDCMEHVHPDDREGLSEVVQRMREGEKMITRYRVRHRDGRYFWVDNNGVTIRDRDGVVTGIISVHRDITEQVRAEEALVESEARYRNIVEHAVEGIFQTTPDGTFISANAALARMAGYGSAKEMLEDVTSSVTDFYASPADRVRHLDFLEKEGLAINFEFPARRKDGSVFWVSANTRAVKGPDGTTAFYEGRVEDITARKRVEQELEAYKDNLEKVVEKRTAELRDRERELRQKTRYLEEANVALRVILAQREKDTREMQEAVLNNVREFVLPQVQKLRLLLPDDGQRMCLEVIGKNLETVVSPYINIMKRMDKRLTPQEIQVSNLVRQGHSTKTIAELMNLSTRTVDCHRANIRKKLGIHNRKINLRVRLSTLDS
ncbi:MAG TPA: PAS domain S-box protein, partial [Syntrophales bacterium]|nr:PAS domain S-box protein [Syntrophales bacterium]